MGVDVLVLVLGGGAILVGAVVLWFRENRTARRDAALARRADADRRVRSELERTRAELASARAEIARVEADHLIERLAAAVLDLSPAGRADGAQALHDASGLLAAARAERERSGQSDAAGLGRAATLAAEGLAHVRGARIALGRAPGSAPPGDHERRSAGRVTERRTATVCEYTVTASPTPSETTPHYFPGGTVAAAAIPEGWYSQAWWTGVARDGAGWRRWAPDLLTALFVGADGNPYRSGVWPRPSAGGAPSGTTTYGSIGVGGDVSGAGGHGGGFGV